jgi:O-antigen/teichoic acid export membrane protein
VSLLFTFPSSLFLHFFTGLGRQRLWTVCAGWALVLHVALDLALIPWLDFQGAVWATLAAEAGLFALAWYLLRHLDVRLSLARLCLKPLAAGAAVALILYLTPGVTLAGMAVRAALALTLYGLLLWLLKVFTVKGLVTLMRGRPLLDEA